MVRSLQQAFSVVTFSMLEADIGRPQLAASVLEMAFFVEKMLVGLLARP